VQAPGDDHVDGEAGFETLLACQVPDAAAAREDGLEHLEASAGLLEEREDVALAILDGDDARLGAAVLRFAYRRPSLVLGSSVEDRRRENAKRQALRAERQARAQPQARAVGMGKDVGVLGLTAGAEVEAPGALHDQHHPFTAHARKRGQAMGFEKRLQRGVRVIEEAVGRLGAGDTQGFCDRVGGMRQKRCCQIEQPLLQPAVAELGGSELLVHPTRFRRRPVRAQSLKRRLAQRIEKDALLRHILLVQAILAPAPGRQPDLDPVGRPIRGPDAFEFHALSSSHGEMP